MLYKFNVCVHKTLICDLQTLTFAASLTSQNMRVAVCTINDLFVNKNTLSQLNNINVPPSNSNTLIHMYYTHLKL